MTVKLSSILAATVALVALAGLTPAAVSAPSAPPPVEAYGHLPSISQVSLSPSGERMLSLGDVGGKRQVLVRKVTGEVLLAAPVGENKIRSVKWVGEDNVLVTFSATGMMMGGGSDEKQEYYFTLNLDLAGHKSAILFDHDPQFVAFNLGIDGAYVINGVPYAFIRNIPKEGRQPGALVDSASNTYFRRYFPDLWKVNLQTNKVERVVRGTETVGSWVVSPDGSISAYSDFNPQTSTWTLLHAEQVLMTRVSPRNLTGLAGAGRVPGSVLVIDHSGAQDKAIEVQADGKQFEILPNNNVTGWITSDSTDLLLGAIIDYSTFAFFDKGLQAKADAAIKPFSGRNIFISSQTDNLDKVVLHTSGRTDSGTYWLVDLKGHKADIIDNDFPGVPDDQVGAVRRIFYKAGDGTELDGILTLPPGRVERKLPLIMLPHGGPIDVDDEVRFDWMAQAFASRGYAVFQPNYRGSSGHGAYFKQSGFGEFGRKMLSDMSDGMTFLAAEGIVDPKRACIVGTSYGGYAALAGVTVQHGLYRCAASISGLSDLPRFMTWQEDHVGRNSDAVHFWREAMGVTVPGAPDISSISPALLAAKADAPVLLIHGRDDSTVPLEQSERMARMLTAAGKPVELQVTEGEDHNLSRESTRIATLKSILAFVQKHNPAD
jgi:dipeptidyl aminopeptidase/acylaminoacyl peptidase